MKKLNLLLILFIAGLAAVAQPVNLGTTTYGIQTNGPARNLIRVYADGKISTVWTGSSTLDGLYSDRGTYYNNFDGVSWDPSPTLREETVRTGFGEIVTAGTKEVIISHSGTTLEVFRNTAIGSSTFTETTGSNQIIGLWPSVYCPEGTDDIYVVCANAAASPTAYNFSRSMDGGDTWAVLNSPLPFLTTAEGFGALTGNGTEISVLGNTVYILYGSEYSDVVLLKSTAKGNAGTWTSQVIYDYPINNYTGAIGQTTDANGDFVADTILSTDSYYSMIVTDDGTAHVWMGAYRMLDADAGTAGWSYFPVTTGMFYWNSATASLGFIDFFFDTNTADGFNDPFAGIGQVNSNYQASFTSMTTAAYDEALGRIYLVYAMPMEYSDIYFDPFNFAAESFRDLFGTYSEDNGLTWSAPVNLTNTALTQKENVYPTAFPDVVNGKIHVMWQQDNNPGSPFEAANPDPITINNMFYQAFTPEDFGAPVCDVTTPPTGLFASPIGTTNAKLNWNAVPLAYQYQVQYFNTATPATKLKKKSFTNSVNLTGLTPGATYNCKVKTICPGGSQSAFSPSSFFTTLLREGSTEVHTIIYPNPSNGIYQISATGLTEEQAEIIIVSTIGEQVFNQTYATTANGLETSVDISHLPKGMYILQIRSGNNIDTGKIILE